jgi:hypothetical protein
LRKSFSLRKAFSNSSTTSNPGRWRSKRETNPVAS